MTYKRALTCLKFSLLACLLLQLQPAYSQYNFNEVDDLIAKNEKSLGGSIVMMIYPDGKIVYKKEIGEEFKMKTQAPVANCSMWLTAALVMTFVDEGKISLDDPVTKYIPIFESYSKRYITIRNCLAHTTGIEADAPTIKTILQKKKFATLEDEVISFAKREIEKNPGQMFYYSNIGLNIAGRILEIVSKKTFDRLVQERLLRPLKMRNTTFYVDYDQSFNPSSGALSSANDYLTFLTMILNKGMFEGKRILSEKAIAEMQKIQTGDAAVKYVPPVASGYGYGLGEWIMDADAKGNATAITCPAPYGTWPVVDYCRGYACIFFVKSMTEQNKSFYQSLKEAIDQQITSTCK